MTLLIRASRTIVCALLLAVTPVVFAQAVGRTPAQPEPGFPLSLREAIELALDNNLDIRVMAYERSLAEERVTTARGAFEPTLSLGLPGASNLVGPAGDASFGGTPSAGGFGFGSLRQPTSTALAGADIAKNRGFASFLNFGKSFTNGFRVDASYSVSRTTTNSFFQSLDPAWNNTLAVSMAQPLLRGSGEEGAALELLVARASTTVSEEAFRAQVETVLLEVERAYWELVFAVRDLEVKTESRELASQQLDRTRAQVEVGLIAPVQETQAEVQLAQRDTDLIVARNVVADAADGLRALLRADRLPNGWDTQLLPTEDPDGEPTLPDLDRAVALALESRPEIARDRATLAVREVEVEGARDGLLPRADLVGQLSTNGIGGDLFVRDGFPGQVIDVIPGGYGDALDQLTGLGFVSWRIGLNVVLPLGNKTAEGLHAQATIHEDRAATELERTRQQVVLEVRRAWRGVQAAADAYQSTRKTRELAERQLEIETDRFDVGMSTNFEVLEFQEDLAGTRSAELRALIELRLAQTELQRAMGLLLERYGVSIG